MISAPRVCPKCGAEIPSDAPGGGCPGCLFENGLGLLPDARDASTVISTKADKGGSAENLGANAAAATGDIEKAARVAEPLGELGDYELLEVVGRGGQGVVYLAHQKSLNRTVALKMISVGSWATEAHLKRFLREAEAAASLEHPGIVPIYEVGERDGSWYFSMRFVEGGQLDQVIKQKLMPLRQSAELISKVARTVHYAHEHGILHRDIKPGNILIDAKGEPLLTDFGLARLVEAESTVTRTKEVMGTPSYMAPEQAMGNNAAVSSATDVYGLGAVLYQLLTSNPPFAGGTTYETIKLVMDTEPRQPRLLNPKIDRDLSTICLKSLEKDPKRRYASALALAEDLEHWLKHEPILARRTGFFTRARKWVRRNPSAAGLIALLVALAAMWGSGKLVVHMKAVSAVPTPKSVAVLPFSNLSKEEQNAYFADGVQDQILTDLSQIADLKVISRTSVMQYKSGVARNLRKIAEELGVAHVVEGSVQRAANKIRVSAQLIDARTDVHLWAQTYDRDLADIFAIQSEIAKAIADQLQAKLSPSESHALSAVQTHDTEAYDLFLRAEYEFHQAESSLAADAFDRAGAFYRQALARDPNFAEAAAELARSRLWRHPLAPAELEEVKSLIDRALVLAPSSPEAHLALGSFFYYGHRQYEMALAEFNRTLELQPNNALAQALRAWVYRRRGEWERSLADNQRAEQVDPRNAQIAPHIGATYLALRQWKDAERAELRALAIDPHNTIAALYLLLTRLNSRGDVESARRTLDGFPEATNFIDSFIDRGDVARIINARIYLDVMERRFTDAFQAVEKEVANNDRGHLQQLAGRVALRVLAGQTGGARSAAEQALPLLEARLRERPDDTFVMTGLSWVYLALGRNADALRVSRQAANTISIEKDSFAGPNFQNGLAQIEARAGAPEEAIKRLRRLLSIPAGQVASIARLKIDPVWDPIRNRPDFQQLLSGPEQIGPNK